MAHLQARSTKSWGQSTQIRERQRNDLPVQLSQGPLPYQHFDLILWASRIVRQFISVVIYILFSNSSFVKTLRRGRIQIWRCTVSCLRAQKYLLNEWMKICSGMDWMHSPFGVKTSLNTILWLKVWKKNPWLTRSYLLSSHTTELPKKRTEHTPVRKGPTYHCFVPMLRAETQRTSWIQSHLQDTKQSGFYKICKSF